MNAITTLTATENLTLQEFTTLVSEVMPENLVRIVLYGSKARGDFHEGSDLDVLLLVKECNVKIEDQIGRIAFDLLLKYEVLLSPMVLTAEHFSYLGSLQAGFFQEIAKDGIDLRNR